MSDISASNFYCDEQLLDDEHVFGFDAADASSPPALYSSPSDESSFVSRLLDSEPNHMPCPDYIGLCHNRPVHLTSRQDSIKAILKVNAHFQFKPATAFLSINYFDRFLSSHTFPDSGRPFQLLSVACLSLAAKMEELYVPPLLDLQMLETQYIFEPKAIQRMELLVMATLKWRLRSVTPFNYLHYFISMIPSSSSKPNSLHVVHSLASNIIINTTRGIIFLGFPPSVVAAAAVISAGGEGVRLPDNYDERISRELVRSCHQLMEEYLLDTCPFNVTNIEPLVLASPLGVLDAAACGSCDTPSENTESRSGPASGSAEAERENKRPRFSTPDVQEEP